MLIQFSVENYRSFDSKVTLNMTAGRGSELPEHVISRNNLSLLKTAAIYGPNASGKSNLLKALLFMRKMVITSVKEKSSFDEIPITPFLLNDESRNKPSSFEAVILISEKIYRYGFSVSKKEILEEWLFEKDCKPKSKEICLFKRVKQSFETRHPNFEEGDKKLDSFLRHNTLYVTLLDSFNGTISKSIKQWFHNINFSQDRTVLLYTVAMLKKKIISNEWLDRFISSADVGIKSVSIKKEALDEKTISGINKIAEALFDDKLKSQIADYDYMDSVKTTHNYFSSSTNKFKTVEFDMNEQESDGTKRLFSLAGHLFVSLVLGKLMIIDEIETSLHPFLIDTILTLFQSEETNPNGAQLIITTHNTSLLTNDRFRRDEVWFTEKDEFGATDLYSLIEYSPRKDSSFNKDYLRGKYGALPFVNVDDFISMFTKTDISE